MWPYLVFAVVAGAMIPFQAGVNARLSVFVGDPVRAAFVSFLVGTIALLIVSAAIRKPLPGVARLGDAPPWVWIGGLLGAFYVAGSIYAAPKLGAALLIAAVVAGQTAAAVMIDQFGWVGFREQHITAGRVAGVVLVAAGVTLVRVF